ncbi:glycosyltransferase [Serratia marcescens]|uniref:glycosyltransferase n=1 Tax=Serratia TaxID=613 RepID=UPI001EFF4084|nr:glycosyltransferase [Serratia marcescens]
MKILHVAETIKGGVATIMRQLVIEQQNTEDEVFCIVPKQQISELAGVKENVLYPFNRSGRNITSLFSLLFCFLRTVLTNKPDIIHLHSSFAGFLCRAVLPIISISYHPKVIYCPHGFSFLMDIPDYKKRFYACIERLLERVTDKIICVSVYEYREAIKRGLTPECLVIIYNGVQNPLVITKDNPYMYTNKKNILFVGRTDYQKGFDHVLNVTNLLSQNEDVHVTVIGDYVIEYKSLPLYGDKITYIGWLRYEDIAPYFLYATVLLMPSRWEAFGLVAAEAQSYGLPVLAFEQGSLPEIIINEVTGFLVEYGDIKGFASVICDKDLGFWKTMSARSYNNYRENFRSCFMTQKVSALYRAVRS